MAVCTLIRDASRPWPYWPLARRRPPAHCARQPAQDLHATSPQKPCTTNAWAGLASHLAANGQALDQAQEGHEDGRHDAGLVERGQAPNEDAGDADAGYGQQHSYAPGREQMAIQ